jgi:hypothetical protein
MGKQRVPLHPNSQQQQKRHAALPPHPRRDQQQQQQQQQYQEHQSSHVLVGTTIAGAMKKSSYLATTTGSSLTESHLPNFRNDHVGNSSYSQSSGSDQSQSTRDGQLLQGPPNKSYVSSSSSTNNSNSSQKLFYTSPRCELSDAQIFPSSPVKRKSLTNVDDRWQTMSEQAGSHRQDSSVLHVSRRHMTPAVLKAGVLPQVARRVRELHLRLEQAEDMLPEWLDVIADKFENLEHLVLTRDNPENLNEQPNRLRRLYILYRLPHLVCIDNVPVSQSERRLARPDDPDGHRVVSKQEWYHLGGKSQKNKNNTDVPKNQAQSAQAKPQSREKRDVRHDSRRVSVGKPKRQSAQDIDDDFPVDGLDDLMRESDEEEDNDNTTDDRLSSLAEMISESVEGYELDLNLADAIQRITEPKNKVSRKKSGRKQRDGLIAGGKTKPDSPKKAASPNNKATDKYVSQKKTRKHGSLQHINDKNRPQAQEATYNESVQEDTGGDPTTDFLEDDSTVTSAYGYGHWSGACFAPFQVCTSQKPSHKKSKPIHFSTRNKLQNSAKAKIYGNPNTDSAHKNRKKQYHSISHVVTETTATTKRSTGTLVDPPGVPTVPDPPIADTMGSPLPPKSFKYSSMVDETNLKQELKQRRKLFRESTASASHGETTSAPSSRRSHKYSKLLVEVNDMLRNDSSEDENDMSTRSKGQGANSQLPPVPPNKIAPLSPNRDTKQLNVDGATALGRQPKPRSSPVAQLSKSQSLKGASQQHPQGESHKNRKPEPIKVPPLDDDEVGTMTGVSIKIADDANSGMSVATIPSVLQRQAKIFDAAMKAKDPTTKASATNGESLASRRSLAGVTIDVPPISPGKVPHRPHPKEKAKPLKSSSSDLKVKDTNAEIMAKKQERQLSQHSIKEETKLKQETLLQAQEETDEAKTVKRKQFPLVLQTNVEDKKSMDSLEGPTDPEIVDMVLSKLGKLFQTPPSLGPGVKTGVKIDSRNRGSRGDTDLDKGQPITAGAAGASAAALQFPRLTPTSDKTASKGKVRQAENQGLLPRMSSKSKEESPQKACGDQENMPHFAEASVASEERNEKATGEQQELTNPRGQGLSSSGDDESASGSVNPASTKTSHSQSLETNSGDSGRSKKNFNELETRLDNIIQNTGRLPSALRHQRRHRRFPRQIRNS